MLKTVVFLLLINVAIIPLLLSLFCLKNWKTKAQGFFSWLYIKFQHFFHFKVYIRILIEAYFHIFLSAITETHYETGVFSYWPSYVCALTFTILLLGIIFVIPAHWYIFRNDEIYENGVESIDNDDGINFFNQQLHSILRHTGPSISVGFVLSPGVYRHFITQSCIDKQNVEI